MSEPCPGYLFGVPLAKSKQKSLTEQLAAAAKAVAAAHDMGDAVFIREATSRLHALQRQQQLVADKAAEVGAVGFFPANAPSQEVAERRKRSAVKVGDIVQLPLTANDDVACPNTVIRSALFGICSRGQARAAMVRAPIAAENGVEILYTGVRLGQKDFTVWLHCLRLVKDNLASAATLSVYALTKEMGLTNSAANYESILDSLARISSATVALRREKDEVMIENRLLTYRVTEQNGVHTVQLKVDPQWASLFGVGRWTKVSLDSRHKLKGKELALWLAENVATHNGKVGLQTRALHKLCGSTAELKEFRKMLKIALADCHTVGLLTHFQLQATTDALTWVR